MTLKSLICIETSLSQIEAIQKSLKQDELALRAEIDVLMDEMRRDQSPYRMQLIQEMIAVCHMHLYNSRI